MLKQMKKESIFGLDIGTRSIVGTVGHRLDSGEYYVEAIVIKEHTSRAMLDGQIHDVLSVTQTIKEVTKELEEKTNKSLKDVCIAAAGRVLKTVNVNVEKDFKEDILINEDHVYALEMSAVEKAYSELRTQLSDIESNFYCVGYSAVNYFINKYPMKKLEGHKGRSIGVELIATFLPVEVIEDLYTAVENAGLNVVNLTLEPIAAINVAIPEKFRLLNIALVDVGAGTSDICITKDGSIVAYGMIPYAGDEITEYIAKKYLVEFNEAERIKVAAASKSKLSFEDILGIKHNITSEELLKDILEGVRTIAKSIADRITELNGNKAVSAVFVVGGGAKIKGFTEAIAEYMDIIPERVALRGEEVLKEVEFDDINIKKDSILVTPIGICLDYYTRKNNFVNVMVNDNAMKLYNTSNLTITDVAAQLNIQMERLFARKGKDLNYTVNKKKKCIKGEYGEASIITLNGENATLNSKIKANDIIHIQESTVGKDASLRIKELKEFSKNIRFTIDNKIIEFSRIIKVNDTLTDASDYIKEKDVIEIPDYMYASQIIEYMDLGNSIALNMAGRVLAPDIKVKENSKLTTFELKMDTYEPLEYVDGDVKNAYNDEMADKEDYMSDYEQMIAQYEKEEMPLFDNKGSSANNDTSVTKEKRKDIVVAVNGKPVKLSTKKSYIFVDILDYYPFDTNTLGGTKLVMNVNSKEADFTTPIKENDQIDLYWAN